MKGKQTCSRESSLFSSSSIRDIKEHLLLALRATISRLKKTSSSRTHYFTLSPSTIDFYRCDRFHPFSSRDRAPNDRPTHACNWQTERKKDRCNAFLKLMTGKGSYKRGSWVTYSNPLEAVIMWEVKKGYAGPRQGQATQLSKKSRHKFHPTENKP